MSTATSTPTVGFASSAGACILTRHIPIANARCPPTAVPIRLTEVNFVGEMPTMLLTYDLENIQVGPQSVEDFAIPHGYSHSDCERNVGGFPYIHAFHYYLRF